MSKQRRKSKRRWNLLFDNGVIVKLPESGWRKQLAVLEQLVRHQPPEFARAGDEDRAAGKQSFQ
jgi:cell division septal protein FtsQ